MKATRKSIPKSLQPILWSVRIKDLDWQKDKVFIINQILAFGGLEELKWLFVSYPKKVVKSVFLTHPMKIYRAPTFHFIKEIILDLRSKKNDQRKICH